MPLILTFSFSAFAAETQNKCDCTSCVCVPEKAVKKKKPKAKKPTYSKVFTEPPPPDYYPYAEPAPAPKEPEQPKRQYVLREPAKENCYKKWTLNGFIGRGQPGLVTETNSDQYVFKKGDGIIAGPYLQYHFSDTLNAGLGGFVFPPGNNSWFIGLGYSTNSLWPF